MCCRCIITTSTAPESGQTLIKGPVILCQSVCLSLTPPHSSSDLHSLYTLTINNITEHKLLRHVQDWHLICFSLIRSRVSKTHVYSCYTTRDVTWRTQPGHQGYDATLGLNFIVEEEATLGLSRNINMNSADFYRDQFYVVWEIRKHQSIVTC